MGKVENLIARIQEGDMKAFEDLLEVYQKKIYNLAFTLTGNPADAEDLAQEIVIKVYIALPSFVNDGRSFDAWLHRIGVNLWIDWWRRRKKIQLFSLDAAVTTEDGELRWEIASSIDDPGERVRKKELWETLWRAMGELPLNCRLALGLRVLNGYSYKEIAALTKSSEAAVKSRINRGRESLKRKLAKEGFLP